jgi:aspartyl-tRNA(Asn)/glutamyl-tRNA(Gln) amidotransferase subunit C
MALTSSDVTRIAHLARIEITEAQTQQTLLQLNEIFKMIEQLQAVDTTGIAPMSHPLGGSQRLREDLATSEHTDREAIMRNAPASQDGLFLVPKVIE